MKLLGLIWEVCVRGRYRVIAFVYPERNTILFHIAGSWRCAKKLKLFEMFAVLRLDAISKKQNRAALGMRVSGQLNDPTTFLEMPWPLLPEDLCELECCCKDQSAIRRYLHKYSDIYVDMSNGR